MRLMNRIQAPNGQKVTRKFHRNNHGLDHGRRGRARSRTESDQGRQCGRKLGGPKKPSVPGIMKKGAGKSALSARLATTVLALVLSACGGGHGGAANTGLTRSYWMGTTPFFATPAQFPDWRFEDLDDKDMLSIHVDDFWGVPWDQCNAAGCAPPPVWVAKWSAFAGAAKSKGKTLYLALSPLGGRKTLAPRVDVNGDPVADWAPVDANGCYRFDSDVNAADHKAAYISYMKYIIDLVGPRYVSPAIEMNIPFSQCPLQKTAWIAWYSDVHNAIKAAYPGMVVFPTFQMEHLYGISDAQAACSAGISRVACFEQRLTEALTVPGDRIAFSTYPILWKYLPDYSGSFPTDTYARVKSATPRKIWIAETGWAAVKIRQSYQHGASGSCGADLFPASIANDTQQEAYLHWLLGEAQTQGFEAVIWWLNRDYFDGPVAAGCPCSPATSDTCVLADAFYNAGGATVETLLRLSGNMALRNYDGSPRPARNTWRSYFNRSHSPVP
jgi:hypothetical protein